MKSLLYTLLLLSPLQILCNEWNSFVLNFDKNQYGRGSQTWQIEPYDETWTFFANKSGLLQFDGSEWSVFPMNNRLDLRSVLASKNQKRIYVGGINEFGYYEPNHIGKMKYYCLSDSLSVECRYIGNVWGIHEVDNIIYFQGDSKVVKYLNGKYTSIEMNRKIDCSNTVRGTLYLGTDQGVWVLIGNSFFPLQGAESLASNRIRGVIPYNDGVLIVTAYKGLYYYDGKKVQPFKTGAEEFMLNNEVFSVAYKGDKVALGTIHKGILLVDLNSFETRHINEFNGLYNNTILSMAFDCVDNLWAGSDNGISYIHLNSSYSNLYTHPYSFGTGYAAAIFENKLFLGTNRGLYYTSYPIVFDDNMPKIKPFNSTSGQVWNLCRIDDDLFCMHDRGMFKIEDSTLKRVGDIVGTWYCHQLMSNKKMMFVGAYDGLYLAEKVNGEWKFVSRVDGFDESCPYFEQESDNIVWIENGDHVVKIELDRDYKRVVKSRSYFAQDGFPAKSDITLTKIKGDICFVTNSGLFRHNPESDKMEPYSEVNNDLTGNPFIRLKEDKDRLFSLSPYEISIINKENYKRGANTTTHPICRSLIELVPKFESLIPINDSQIVIPNENGFALLSHSISNKERNYEYSLFIKKMHTSDSLLYRANFLKEKGDISIEYDRSIILEYSVSNYGMIDDVRYQYKLNDEPWSSFSSMETKEYSQLKEGNYIFQVRALFPDGSASLDQVNFTVLAPWYRTNSAYLFYVLTILSLSWMVYKWDDKRVRLKKVQAVVEKEHQLLKLEEEFEIEKREKEKQIMQLENEKLEHALEYKSQEMTNLMINFTRKNDMLNEIKSEISKVTNQLKPENTKESKQLLMIINNKIDSNIQNDDVLKRIEEQFDLLHNNFMKRLESKHPDLSNNERMMCAYLKMKLSSKEIAPLLNISVRGVETTRYRLRKKLNLEREDGLIEYLDKFL
ncbi:MAG: transcriptional regulator [Bacteroidales bacterium]